ncbi:cytochrome c-type biogenesis protein CcmH [Myxococcota bacterium]|nr:cytochrome c-type biogenesis protein CcmH [Myxococcota bacterium]MBU1429157.1 cytochrome c-type biogenesis protein CcmH [Myxococcota bacterium]MBU1898786.1 cytochrome c-type biogenesis protein CcmH [Myxococcota bacterium]
MFLRCTPMARGALFLTLSALAPAFAAEPPPAQPAPEEALDRRIQGLSDELLSPFCPGKTVTNCTSYQAYQLRGEMREMAKEGLSDEAIVAKLRAAFDTEERKIANPAQPWYTFFVPILPFLLGGLLIVWVFLRWRHKRPQGEAPVLPPDADKLARLRAMTAAEDE